MSNDREFLDDRRQALEEAFFKRQNEQLLTRMREQARTGQLRSELAELLGIKDEGVLDRLLASGIEPRTVLAMQAVPLVAVAWADGRLDDSERKAILAGAEELGISPDTAAYSALEQWLAAPPPAELLEHWLGYTEKLVAETSPAERSKIGAHIISRARAVAKARGGVLGFGAISAAEQRVLDRLAGLFGS